MGDIVCLEVIMIPQIIVVDDDPIILKRAWSTLTDAGFKVVVLKSGKALLEHTKDNPAPNLILMDITMPEMDGFEVIKELKKGEAAWRDTPVIFLTANEDDETETKGLSLGAMDFIRKPFVASVLVLRVRHAVELIRLQKDLESMVDEKTRENEDLFLHVVESLADAIDAKDNYTKGHSGRVAIYSKEIGKRFGYDEKRQERIFMMALLHDVGKIGVPDEVINKPGRLTDEEFASIKKHPGIGGKILGNIKEMPELASGAKWHHERYDGSGYPEGISGDAIPEEARIIAVADAYDAMTSNRSYRGALPQETVRGEIAKGKGSQFDPKFADIMLEMIDDDKEYLMRDRTKKE
jgi:putative two-component system response regulator